MLSAAFVFLGLSLIATVLNAPSEIWLAFFLSAQIFAAAHFASRSR